MSWTKIKKALNDSIGTKQFKPLNRILDDGFNAVKILQNEIKHTADNTLQKLESGENDFISAKAKAVDGYVFEDVTNWDEENKMQITQTGLYMCKIKANLSRTERTLAFFFIDDLKGDYHSTPILDPEADYKINYMTIKDGILSMYGFSNVRVYRLNIIIKE